MFHLDVIQGPCHLLRMPGSDTLGPSGVFMGTPCTIPIQFSSSVWVTQAQPEQQSVEVKDVIE